MPNPTLFGRTPSIGGRDVFENNVESSTVFDGEGDSAQSNKLDGTITVSVAQVLPNGYLVVQGEKWIGINQGDEFMRLRGIVRPVDIRADNTVLSTQVGNAQIAYGGTGVLADTNRQGWLTRFFSTIVWPL
jgi:flagellar L-ring protein precursor FlgH